MAGACKARVRARSSDDGWEAEGAGEREGVILGFRCEI
jgi:hypothetical protein